MTANPQTEHARGRACEVAVVGAGLAGLTTASRLQEAGIDTVVLEATSEVGGRTRSRLLADRMIDVGGELVGQNYLRIRRLVDGLGLHLEANARFTRVRCSPEARPPLRPATARRLAAVARHLRYANHALAEAEPWKTPYGRELDQLSLAEYLDRAPIDERTARLLGAVATAFTTAPPERLSLLHFLMWIRPAGGLSAIWRDTRWRIREGAQQISRRLAARLAPRVVLDAPIQVIDQTSPQVVVQADDGRRWEARHVAVCVPLATTSRITCLPNLPTEQSQLLAAVDSPAVTKLIAVPAPDRRKRILALGDPILPVASRDPVHALGFAYGDDTAMNADRLQKRLLERLDFASHDIDGFLAYAWHDQLYAQGGYPAFAPGQLTRYGPSLRTSHGHVHFGGADRSTWPSTMEGAVRDGERLATHLLNHYFSAM